MSLGGISGSLPAEGEFFLEGGPDKDKAVLMVHGLTGSPLEFKWVSKQLASAGFAVYCPLLKGHGGSPEELLKATRHDWLQTVREGRDFLRSKGYKKIYAAGMCLGASLILKLLADEPDSFEAASLYSVAFRYDGWGVPRLLRWFSWLLPVVSLPGVRYLAARLRFMDGPTIGIKNERIRNKFSRIYQSSGVPDAFPSISVNEVRLLNNEVEGRLASIRTPTLVIHAREDETGHIRNMLYLLEHVGSQCEAHVLTGSYHLITLDQEKRKVAEMTVRFFLQNSQGS